jgi:hypothetical protein
MRLKSGSKEPALAKLLIVLNIMHLLTRTDSSSARLGPTVVVSKVLLILGVNLDKNISLATALNFGSLCR